MVHSGKIRILLAEDDTVSRTLLDHMICGLGYSVTAVANGAEALRTLGINPDCLENSLRSMAAYEAFDLMLIDLNMPDMDGFEAVALLRSMEERWRGNGLLRPDQRLPVVGMSATNRASEWDACQNAGMDELLEKPFHRDRLGAVLGQQLDQSRSAAQTAQALPQPANPDEKPSINVAWLREAVNNDPDLLCEVAADFRKLTPVYLSGLAAAASRRSGADMAQSAHKIAGSASYLGAEQLCAEAKALERLAREGHTEEAAQAVSLVQTAFDRADARLADLLQEGLLP